MRSGFTLVLLLGTALPVLITLIVLACAPGHKICIKEERSWVLGLEIAELSGIVLFALAGIYTWWGEHRSKKH